MPPNFSTARSTASSTDSASRMSPTIGNASPPASRISSAAVWIVPGSLGCGSSVLAISATLAPSWAARSAIANPTPRLPPDMKIVLPSKGTETLSVATYLLLPSRESAKFTCKPRRDAGSLLFNLYSWSPRRLAGGRSNPIGELFAQVLPFGVLLRNDHGANGFDPLLVRQADYRDLGDRLVFEEGVLHVAPGYLHAAGVYDVLYSVHNVEVALFVEIAEVAGVEPAALELLFGLLGFLPITRHELRGTVDDLAGFVGRRVVHLRVHDSGLD